MAGDFFAGRSAHAQPAPRVEVPSVRVLLVPGSCVPQRLHSTCSNDPLASTPAFSAVSTMSTPLRRTVSADPGLLSTEELLASQKGERRKSLERLVAMHNQEQSKEAKIPILARIKEKVRWFLEHARIKVSVSLVRTGVSVLLTS